MDLVLVAPQCFCRLCEIGCQSLVVLFSLPLVCAIIMSLCLAPGNSALFLVPPCISYYPAFFNNNSWTRHHYTISVLWHLLLFCPYDIDFCYSLVVQR